MLRESADARRARPAPTGRPTSSEDRGEIAEVARLFPEAIDYLDVYDRAGGLGPRTILAHAIHLSDREVARLAETGTHVAHCPASNLFLASGAMPLARYLAAGIRVGLGSDVAGGPGAVDLRGHARRRLHPERPARARRAGEPATRRAARAARLAAARRRSRARGRSGSTDAIGSLEAGKEADLIAVDPRLVGAARRASTRDDPAEVMSRLVFRAAPGHGPRARGSRGPAPRTGPPGDRP